ncbi:MAG: hypothetical protein A2486_00705 [Burkholderiales bacterium RIFOXYC12_FULL_65_23]|uniref:hypothetical protein n=1 Tax=Malikia spinosa TaxID=86180 RepID=UPI0008BD9DF5|nr:MAG: hypothetical protein A2486_00705 [Burkholderiales bacterium RIFOXYC12_FULL_65_23]
MNRLDTELHRLYLPQPTAPQQAEPAQDASPALIGADGQVRALVLELASAAGWEAVAALWQGLQNELELPAPAIAISGAGYQVWISLAQPVSVAQARGFLESLCRRFLAGIAPRHVRLLPSLQSDAADAPEAPDIPGASVPARHARLIPAQLDESGHWSAFISPHLAAMFADEPWLDMKPSPDAQADLLLRLKSLSPADWRRAQLQLEPAEAASTFAAASSPLPAALPDPAAATGNRPDVENSPDAQASATTGHQEPRAASVAEQDPRRFLLAVMNDPTVEMGMRIEAAKALLPYSTR